MSLAGGGFTVARKAGVTMGVELELTNIAEVPITYWGFHDATFPIFQVEEFVDQEWHELPMGFCGSGTGLQRFLIEAGGKQRMLVPLPEGTAPLRFAVDVASSSDSEHSDKVSAEWRS
ncbi:MAG: hypothetical protein DHS20C04_32150 [Hyphococcus sp.]|nr:MAG: hypothetical protein DHS20C04_32150 [Marinicaulis sp.]